MWRGTEGEGIKEESELLLGFLIRDTHDGEYAFLHVTAVNTNGATADFVAVAHDVIRIGQSVTGVGVKSIQAFRFR